MLVRNLHIKHRLMIWWNYLALHQNTIALIWILNNRYELTNWLYTKKTINSQLNGKHTCFPTGILQTTNESLLVRLTVVMWIWAETKQSNREYRYIARVRWRTRLHTSHRFFWYSGIELGVIKVYVGSGYYVWMANDFFDGRFDRECYVWEPH